MNLAWLCSTSMVAPSLRTSLATKLLKMMERMEDLPEPLLPIKRTFFFRLRASMLTLEADPLGRGKLGLLRRRKGALLHFRG